MVVNQLVVFLYGKQTPGQLQFKGIQICKSFCFFFNLLEIYQKCPPPPLCNPSHHYSRALRGDQQLGATMKQYLGAPNRLYIYFYIYIFFLKLINIYF